MLSFQQVTKAPISGLGWYEILHALPTSMWVQSSWYDNPSFYPLAFVPKFYWRTVVGRNVVEPEFRAGTQITLRAYTHNLSSYQISSTQCPIFSESEQPWYYLLRIWTALEPCPFTFALNCMGGVPLKFLNLSTAGRFFANFQKLPSFVDQSLGPTKIPIAINSKKAAALLKTGKSCLCLMHT